MSWLKRITPPRLWQKVKAAVQAAAWQRMGPRIERLEQWREADLAEKRGRIEDLEATVEQLRAVVRHEGIVLPPPKHMQVRVVGGYVPGFIESGFSICDDLNSVLSVVDQDLASFQRVLDWGCGCGRTIRALKTLYPGCETHGTDIDEEAIGFLQRRYGRYGEFRLSPHLPPLPYPDEYFDLIIGISVFTHLPEDMQLAWLGELRRITRPGALLVVTTSGEHHYSQFSGDRLERIRREGFLYVDGVYGQSIDLPAFYQNTFHTHDYIRRQWVRFFDVLDIQALRMQKSQDTVLLRHRDTPR